MSLLKLAKSKAQKCSKKQKLLKQIITNLINKKQQLNKQTFTRYEIEQEIIGVCLVSDMLSGFIILGIAGFVLAIGGLLSFMIPIMVAVVTGDNTDV